jgi:hypothetical protein
VPFLVGAFSFFFYAAIGIQEAAARGFSASEISVRKSLGQYPNYATVAPTPAINKTTLSD